MRQGLAGAGLRAVSGCPAGEARITLGFSLKARFVIHAVGPKGAAGSR
jgi:O-acetyl-ADP-ribose deacetylase (regulator of RNase III)